MAQRIHKEDLSSIKFAHKINIFSCTWNCQEGLTDTNSFYYKASRNSHSWDVKLVFKWWKRTSECFMGLTSKWLKHNWLNISASVNIKLFLKVSAMNYLLFFQSSVSTRQFTLILPSLMTPTRITLTRRRMVTYICNIVSNITRLGKHPNYSVLWGSRKSIFSTSTFPQGVQFQRTLEKTGQTFMIIFLLCRHNSFQKPVHVTA